MGLAPSPQAPSPPSGLSPWPSFLWAAWSPPFSLASSLSGWEGTGLKDKGREQEGGYSTGTLTLTAHSLPARKRAMLVNNALALLGGTLMGLANAASSYEMLILGRFLIGAYSGTQGHHGPAQCPALLYYPWVWWEGVGSQLPQPSLLHSAQG